MNKRLLGSNLLLIAVVLTMVIVSPTIMGTSSTTLTTITTTSTQTCSWFGIPYSCGVTTRTVTTSVPPPPIRVPTQCEGSFAATPIINVQYTVINDEDSGNFGYWALDNYAKNVIVWQGRGEANHQFCALVQYQGSGSAGWFGPYYGFQTYAGALSPSFGIAQTRDGSGQFAGSTVTQFTATFLGVNSTKARTGNIGTVDFKGSKADVLLPANQQVGPTVVQWNTYYFKNVEGFSNGNQGWGFVYTTGGNPSLAYYGAQWLNADDISAGDILV